MSERGQLWDLIKAIERDRAERLRREAAVRDELRAVCLTFFYEQVSRRFAPTPDSSLPNREPGEADDE